MSLRNIVVEEERQEIPQVQSTMQLADYEPDQMVSIRLYFDDANQRRVMKASEAVEYFNNPVSERYSPNMVNRLEEDHCGGFC